jgi:hypothetical protein
VIWAPLGGCFLWAELGLLLGRHLWVRFWASSWVRSFFLYPDFTLDLPFDRPVPFVPPVFFFVPSWFRLLTMERWEVNVVDDAADEAQRCGSCGFFPRPVFRLEFLFSLL